MSFGHHCGNYHIEYRDCQLHVPLSYYVESSSFSFCRLYHSLYDFVDDDENLAANGMQVIRKLPVWLMHAVVAFILPLSDWEDVKQRFCLRHLRGKLAIIRAVLDNFVRP